MRARWETLCPKCGTTIVVGEELKAHFVRVGFDDAGKPIWQRVPKSYVHAPKCPKVTPNRPGQRKVDYATGEVT